MDDDHELVAALKRLGETVENAVAPVGSDELGRSTSIDLEAGVTEQPTPHRQRPPARMLVSAAVLVLLALTGVAIISRDRGPAELATATESTPSPEPGGSTQAVLPDDNGWRELRECESSGDYSTDTGNTFFGAYQFTRQHWNGIVGDIGLGNYVGINPADAPPTVQDAAAAALYLRDGLDPWPICGRHISGPMPSPIIPQWLAGPDELATNAIVFFDPDAPDTALDEVTTMLAMLLGPGAEFRTEYVDKAATAAEFEEMFADSPAILDAVAGDELPTSLRIEVVTPRCVDLEPLGTIAGVFEVVFEVGGAPSNASFFGGGVRRIRIPRLGLDVPLMRDAKADNLERTVAVLRIAATPFSAALVANGADEGPFAQLALLEDGDVIEIEVLVSETVDTTILMRLEVDLADQPGGRHPQPVDLADIPAWDSLDQGIFLVTDVAGSPQQRLIVATRPAQPDLSLYGE